MDQTQAGKGAEQPLLVAQRGLTQGIPCPIPIRGPRLTRVSLRGYFGTWQWIKSRGLCPGSSASMGLNGPGGGALLLPP